MLKHVTLLALIAAAALPAAAQQKPAKADKNDPNKQICRTVRSSESRLGGKRECRTKAEWDAMTTQNGDTVRNGTAFSPQ